MNTDQKELLTSIFENLNKLNDREVHKVALVARFLDYIRTENVTDRIFTAEELDEMAETKFRLDAELIARQQA